MESREHYYVVRPQQPVRYVVCLSPILKLFLSEMKKEEGIACHGRSELRYPVYMPGFLFRECASFVMCRDRSGESWNVVWYSIVGVFSNFHG